MTKVISINFSLVSWGHLTWVLGKPSMCVSEPRLTYPSSLRGAYPQALILSGAAKFIAWCLRHPVFGRMLMEPEAFLGMPVMSELWPCAWTHPKMPCATLTHLVGRLTNTTKVIYISWHSKQYHILSRIKYLLFYMRQPYFFHDTIDTQCKYHPLPHPIILHPAMGK